MTEKGAANLINLYEHMARDIRLINGLACDDCQGLTYEERQISLLLNSIFAQWIDHSRTGILEVQLKKSNFVTPDYPWQFWEAFFKRCGFFVFYEYLSPDADFALSVDWNSCGVEESRKDHRDLEKEEAKWLKNLEKQQQKMADALQNYEKPPNRKERRAAKKISTQK